MAGLGTRTRRAVGRGFPLPTGKQKAADPGTVHGSNGFGTGVHQRVYDLHEAKGARHYNVKPRPGLRVPKRGWLPGPLHLEFTGSDHCILDGYIPCGGGAREEVLGIDWDWWNEWVEKEEKKRDKAEPPQAQGASAYRTLVGMVNTHRKRVDISPRSKRWVDEEVRRKMHQVRATPPNAYKTVKKELKRLIRRKKKAHWENFLKENGDRNPWEILRIARSPFGRDGKMGDLILQDGRVAKTDEEKVQAFQAHNLVWTPGPAQAPETPGDPPPNPSPTPTPLTPSPGTLAKVRRAMTKTKTGSAPGPDGIGYKLLKFIQNTNLGKALVAEIGGWVESGIIPEETKGMKMVMIPKPGKDTKKVKGWRPIVLAQTVGKIADKVIAEHLQNLDVFHDLQYGSRRSRSALDALMLTMSHTQRALANGAQVSLIGKDVVGAFNHLRKESLLQTLAEGGCDARIRSYVEHFLRHRSFVVCWDGKDRGQARMNQGTPQGSPLSPILWCIFFSRTLKAIDRTSHLPTGD